MFPPISYDNSFLEYIRKPTRNKKIIVLAKIDGTNFYDISEYVQKITTNNKIELLEDPAIDNAKITVANKNNMFTKTQYNDVFDPSVGKLNGTVEQGYLNKEWEIKIYVEISNLEQWETAPRLPEGAIAYFRDTLVDLVNGITPEGYTEQPEDANKIAIPLFTGIKPENGITEKHKKAEIVVKDILHYAINKELTYPLLYPNYTPESIVSDLLIRAGIAVENQDFQSLTTPFEVYITEENATVWRNILKIIKGTQARFSVTPEGKVIYRTKIENFYDPDIALSIDSDKIQEYELLGEQKYNKIKVESEGYKIDTDISKIINVELQDDENRTIKKGEIETFEFEYKSDFAKDVADTVFISYSSPSTEGIAYDSAFSLNDSDSNIKINKFDIRPDKLILEIENLNTSIDILIDSLKLDGRQINKVSLENLIKVNNTGFPDKEYAIKSFYGTKAMLSNIADVAENLISKDIVFELSLNEFYPELYAGNLINLTLPEKGISNGTFIVNSVTHKIEGSTYKTNITITEYKDVVFNINDKKYEKINTVVVPKTEDQIEFIQGKVEELKGDIEDQKQKTDFLDSNAPAKPTNFSLQTQFLNKRSVIKMSCDENTETDLIGYEFQWSYDQINWTSIQSKDNLAQAEVQGNITVYARVRALDAEGNASLFSSILSVTTAKDSTAPAQPAGITVTANYAGIVFKLTQNTEEDFKEYKLSLNNGQEYRFTGNYKVIDGLQPETTYNYFIVAIDFSGNESTAANGSFTTEKKAASEEITDDLMNNHITPLEDNYDIINSNLTTKEPDDPTQFYAVKKNSKGISSVVGRIDDVDGQGTSVENSISAIVQNADEISSTVEGIKYKYALSVPEGAIAYWSDSIFDKVNGLAPEGYTETWQPYEKVLSTITQHSDEISQRVVAKDMDTGEVLRNTELLISDGKIQVIASMFEVLGDALVNGTITADKLSSLILEANKYIQVGTTTDGYRLDGSTGLSRLIGGEVKKIPSILQRGIVSFNSNETQKAITLNPNATSGESYNVILNAVKFKYWDENFQAQQKRYLTQNVTNKNASGFVINAYTVVSNTNVEKSDSVYISSDSTFTLVSNMLNVVKARVTYSDLEFIYDYGASQTATITVNKSSSVDSSTLVTTQNITVNFESGGSMTKLKNINPSISTSWHSKDATSSRTPVDIGKINLGNFTGAYSIREIKIYFEYLTVHNEPNYATDNYTISFSPYLQGTIEVRIKEENSDGYSSELYAYVYKNSSLVKSILLKRVDFTPNVIVYGAFKSNSISYEKETKTAQNPSYTAYLTNVWTGDVKQSAEADIEYVVVGY